MRVNPMTTTYVKARHQCGLSLVELMVAITVATILLAGIIEIFIHSKQSYKIQNNLNVIQENGRFAVERLAQSIHMADHWGGVEASDIRDITGGSITGIGNCNHAWITDVGFGIRGYEGAADLSSVGMPSGCIPSADYVPYSDVLVLRYAGASDLIATPDLTNAASPNNLQNAFIRSAVGDSGVIMLGSDAVPSALPDQLGTYNYPYIIEVYYLRACSEKISNACVDQKPTLTRLKITTDSANAPALIEEPVVENIEQLQFQYGRDTDGDGNVDQYDPASGLNNTDWADVVNVRISLMSRGDTADNHLSDTTTYNLLDYSHTPSASEQKYHRKQYERIAQIRNRIRQ